MVERKYRVVLDIISSDRPWVEMALQHPRISPDNQPVIDLPYLILMKLEASLTNDLSDISRMLGQASDRELDEAREVHNNIGTICRWQSSFTCELLPD